jgi:hypothetical protein
VVNEASGSVMRTFLIVALAVAAVACAGPTPTPTVAPTPTGASTPTALPLQSLPANLSGIPGPGDITAEVAPQSPSGELTVGVEVNYELGHCGLSSPIDVDGSLWDPIGYQTETGAPATDEQQGELINATRVVAVLIDADRLVLRSDSGLSIVLERHSGPRHYFLCD